MAGNKNMQTIADTILGDADQLAQLHDILVFKARAYGQSHAIMAESLIQCSALAGKASDAIIRDVLHELSVRKFPLSSRVKNADKRSPDNPISLLEEATKTFPTGSLPPVDIALKKIPEQLLELRSRIEHYQSAKDATFASLMEQQDALTDYLIAVAWSEA
jgi:hypothetical protein